MLRILVAMSGGVDSAVAAWLLKDAGHDVTGANMRFWEYKVCEGEPKRITSCCSPEDLADAEKSALGVGIPFYAIRMEADFRAKVIDPFIRDYQNGRTPNPCVNCNTFIKFGEFYEKAATLGFDFIATGHYAAVGHTPEGRWAVFPAADPHKDQSYYLYGLSQEALAMTVFPLAKLTKDQVRSIASREGIPVARKPESQEICFIPENDYRRFLRKEGVEFTPGFFRDTTGRILGRHDGKENFTIGQRRGLQIALGEPRYVIEILDSGDVILGTREELNRNVFYLTDPVFQGMDENIPEEGSQVLAQIRYNSGPVPARVYRCHEDGTILRVELSEPASAVTDGQAGVLYHPVDRYILAGGKIRTKKPVTRSPQLQYS